MTLYKITEADNRTQVNARLTLAELKAICNAVSVDVATGGDTTPGVDAERLRLHLANLIDAHTPPAA